MNRYSGLLLIAYTWDYRGKRSKFDFWIQINESFVNAGKAMWKTLKCPDVWRPCLYMYLSFSLGVNISEGMFYWVTDSEAGPSFSKVFRLEYD